MTGSARSPRRHEKVVRHSRRQSSASSAQVSRSRACRAPPGELPRGRPSSPSGGSLAAGTIWAVGVPAGGCIFTATGQRSAVACRLREWLCAGFAGLSAPRCRSEGPHREHWRRSFATGLLWSGAMPTAEKANGSELRSLPSISGESVKGGPPLSQSVMTNRNLPPRACGAQGSFDFRREAPGGPWTEPQLDRT